MALKKTDTELVGSDIIADLFGMDRRRVQQLTVEGILTAEKVKGTNKYALTETVQVYVKYLSDKANGRESSRDKATEQKKQEAEADMKRSRADMYALQLKELEGKMHRSEDISAVMEDMVFMIRSMLSALPGRLAVEVTGVETAAEAANTIKREVNNILNRLASYEYDPEEYAKRVREREGWLEQNGDEQNE